MGRAAPHTHKRGDELHVFFVPADTDQKMEIKVIHNGFQAMQRMVGGYIEIVRTRDMPELECGCRLVMVVNEEGLIHSLPQNPRASIFYPFGAGIVGDAFILGEGPVPDEDGLTELDLFSLPQSMSLWEGPGSPVPTPNVYADRSWEKDV